MLSDLETQLDVNINVIKPIIERNILEYVQKIEDILKNYVKESDVNKILAELLSAITEKQDVIAKLNELKKANSNFSNIDNSPFIMLQSYYEGNLSVLLGNCGLSLNINKEAKAQIIKIILVVLNKEIENREKNPTYHLPTPRSSFGLMEWLFNENNKTKIPYLDLDTEQRMAAISLETQELAKKSNLITQTNSEVPKENPTTSPFPRLRNDPFMGVTTLLPTPRSVINNSSESHSDNEKRSDTSDLPPLPIVETEGGNAEVSYENELTPEQIKLAQEEKIARDLYQQISNVILERLDGYHRTEDYRKKHFLPFLKSVQYYNGVYCTPLPFRDITAIVDLINEAVNKIDVDLEAGDILCESVRRAFREYNIIFFSSYTEKNSFPSSYALGGMVEAGKSNVKFTFKLEKSDEFLKLAGLESEIIELNDNNLHAAILGRKVATSIDDVVANSLIYYQARVILNVKPTDVYDKEAKPNYWLGCLFQMPSEDKRRKKAISNIKPTDSIVRILLVKAKPNNRIDAIFEVSKLNSESDEFKIALKLIDSLSKKLQDVLVFHADDLSTEDKITNDYSIIEQSELKDFILELELNNRDSQLILSFFGVEKTNKLLDSNSMLIPTTEEENNSNTREKDGNKRRKSSSKESQLQEFTLKPPKKKYKLGHDPKKPSPEDHIREISQREPMGTLFDYLHKMQENNIRTITKFHKQAARYYIKSFDFNKIKVPQNTPVPESEQTQLDEFLNTTILYDYQKNCVNQLFSAYLNNKGIGLFDEMSLGKTIQTCALMQYLLTQKNLQKSFLILAPLSVINKWKSELVDKLNFNEKDVIVFHNKNRNLSLKAIKSNKIIITTYETFLSELKKSEATPLKTAAGYIAKNIFTKLKEDIHDRWSKNVVPSLESTLGHNIVKNTKRIKFLRIPNQEELNTLKETSNISISSLEKLFSSELIFGFLNKNGYINKHGAILKSMADICELDALYNQHPNLVIKKEDVFAKFSEMYNKFALQGLVLDEGHHGVSKDDNQTFIYLTPIAKNLSARKGLRLISTGTPFQNGIKELWTLHEFLNPSTILNREEFMAAYDNLIFNAGKSICQTTNLVGTDNVDQFDESLNESVERIKKAYTELKQIIKHFKQRQVRRTKDEIESLMLQQEASSSYRLPSRVDKQVSWSLAGYELALMSEDISPEKDKLYVRMNGNSLEYTVIAPSGETAVGVINEAELKTILAPLSLNELNPFHIDKLKPFLAEILKFTSAPERGHTILSEQMKLYNNLDKAAIESACRGFAFFHRVGNEGASSSRAEQKGFTLLQHLAKVFDHPILVSEQHKNALFSNTRTVSSIQQHIRTLIIKEHDGDFEKFVNQSGKLRALVNIIRDILKEEDAKIVIATEFVPMAAIIQMIVKEFNSTLEPLIYYGGMTKEKRDELMEKFNNPHNNSDYDKNRVIIISQKAGSEGIDLYGNYVIRYGQTYTYAGEEQTNSRAHRNRNPYDRVTCIKLCGDNPLDKKMNNFVEEKKAWGQFFVDLHSSCDYAWFVDRLKNLVRTSPVFNQMKLNEENLNHVVTQIKSQLEMQEGLRLSPLMQNNEVNESAEMLEERAQEPMVEDPESLASEEESTVPMVMEQEPSNNFERSDDSDTEEEIPLIPRQNSDAMRHQNRSPLAFNSLEGLSNLASACERFGIYTTSPFASPVSPVVSEQEDEMELTPTSP